MVPKYLVIRRDFCTALRMRSKFGIISNELPKNIQETLINAESPFDIMVDYINFWGRVPGLDFLKIDKVQ